MFATPNRLTSISVGGVAVAPGYDGLIRLTSVARAGSIRVPSNLAPCCSGTSMANDFGPGPRCATLGHRLGGESW